MDVMDLIEKDAVLSPLQVQTVIFLLLLLFLFFCVVEVGWSVFPTHH